MIKGILELLQNEAASLPQASLPIIKFITRVLTQARDRLLKYSSRAALIAVFKVSSEQVRQIRFLAQMHAPT